MANLLSTTIRGWIGSKLFAGGFLGSGWRIGKHNGRYKLEIDDIVVRNTMTVFELLIQKIRAVKGGLCITQASGKVKNVDWNRDENYAFLEIEDDMSFVEHDIVRCQSFGNNTLHSYWVVVSEIVGNEIKILKSEFAGVMPKEGDEIVQFGNESRDPKYAGRHSAIYLHADESGLPAIDVLENIYAKTFEGCLKVRLGGDLPGANGTFGLYCVNGMLKGTDNNGNLQYCIYPDGTAEFGCKSAMFKPDRSGHIAGGAISWSYNKEKGIYECKLADNVVLGWENLDEETKKKLKGADGADAVTYKLRTSSSFIPIDADGRAKVNYINVELYRTVGDGTPELCPDACAIYYTVYQGESTGSTTTPQNTAQIKTFTGEITGENPIDKVRIGASVGTGNNQRTVDMLTLEAVHEGFNADWLRGWDTNKTKIGADYFISPKLFSGINEGTSDVPLLTGIIQGKDCLEIKGVKHSGIFAVVKNEIIFSLDPQKKEYKFTGRIEADEGYFYGSISTPAKEITDANSSEYISEYLEGYQLKLSKEKGFNLRFSEGFTIMPLSVFLPLDYNLDGVELNLTHGFSVGFIVVMNVYDENMNKINCNVGPGHFARFKCIVLKPGNSSDSENVKQNNIKWIRLFGGSVSQV